MDEEKTRAKEILHENYNHIKKNGKLYLLFFVATIPGLCYSAIKLHVIKIGASDIVRCEIPSLENSSWKYQEIREISQTYDFHKECYIYDYNYRDLANLSFNEAKKLVDEGYKKTNKRKMCKKFVSGKNNTLPFGSYCESLQGEIYYDVSAIIGLIFSGLFLVPIADIYGRKTILSLGCHLVYISVFLKLILLDFTREGFGEFILNCAYPTLKYTTEAVIVEITGDTLRPLSFVVTFIGLHLPLLIANLTSPTYFKIMQVIAYSVALLLPLLNWYLPESPIWFTSKKKIKTAQFASETLNNSVKHNDSLLILRNKKVSLNEFKGHLQELNKMNRAEFISINVISICVGFLSFYSYTKHKLMYYDLKNVWMKFANSTSGLFAIILSIPCVYDLSCAKILIAVLFLINGVLFSLLTNRPPNDFLFVVLLISIEITSNIIKIVFEFYLQQIFPTSHRCTCTAICGAAMNIGLLILISFRQLDIFASQILVQIMCLIGCLSTILFLKNLPRIKPLLIDFSDIESNERVCKFFCK